MQGERIRCAEDWWVGVIPDMSDRPIKYVEIGVFCGHNLCSVGKTFARHPESKLYAIDPWADYAGYNEKYTQDQNYKYYRNNIRVSGIEQKVVECRGLSENIMPSFADEFFDIVYIDGSHLYDYVVRDCELAMKKVKKGGYIIVDDTNHPPIVAACDLIFNNPENKVTTVAVKDAQRYYRKD